MFLSWLTDALYPSSDWQGGGVGLVYAASCSSVFVRTFCLADASPKGCLRG